MYAQLKENGQRKTISNGGIQKGNLPTSSTASVKGMKGWNPVPVMHRKARGDDVSDKTLVAKLLALNPTVTLRTR